MAALRRPCGHLPAAAVAWLLLLLGSYTTAIGTPDTLGTEFVLAFGPVHPTIASQVQLSVSLTCTEDAQVHISFYDAGTPTTIFVSVVANQVSFVPLPRSLMQVNRGVAEHLGVKVTSDKEIAVSALQHSVQSSDGFLVYPVDVLSKDYLAATYVANLVIESGAYLQIVATDATATTDFTVKTTAATNLGDPGDYTFTMSALQSFLIGSNATADVTLSGSTLAASAPFALFIGSRCNIVPKGIIACDNLNEQMPPPDTLGRRFLLGAFLHPSASAAPGSKSDVVQVMAASDATTLEVGGSLVATLDKGNTYVFEVPMDTAIYLEASGPAYVLHLSKGQASGFTGDPMMIGVPPIYQYANSYIIGVPTLTADATYYLNVMYEGDSRDGVRLDGAAIDSSKWLTVPGNDKAFVARLNVTHNATHILKHQDPQEGVGVEVYAFTAWDSYGWAGGQAIDASRVELGSGCSQDTTPPVIKCPSNPAAVKNVAGTCAAPVTFTNPVVTDNCPGSVNVHCNRISGSSFNVGTSTVTCRAKDIAGNQAKCAFKVTVKAANKCNDGNACTQTDTCKEDGKGTCVGHNNICCGPGKSSKYCGVCVKVCPKSEKLSSDACNVLKFFGQDPHVDKQDSDNDCDVKSMKEKSDRVCPQGTTCCMPEWNAVRSSSKNGYCSKF